MYHKFLFVGLGGSGGKTLRFLKQQITDWLVQHGKAKEDVPAAWQFLHIDVPSVPDGGEIDHLAARLAPNEYLGLIPRPVEFSTEQRNLDSEPTLQEELISWRVEPANLSLNLTQGAGQYRAVGHVVAMAHSREIADAIKDAQQKMNEPRASSQLRGLYQQVHGKPTAEITSHTYVVIISSLAGGAGAGMLSIVCDLARGLSESGGTNLFSILYTPEVFSGINPAARSGVQANSLAATGELLNGIWFGAGQPESTDPVLALAGCATPMNRYGPEYPFLVGKRNASGVEYGSAEQLFSTVGRSLLSWVVDFKMQARFLAYTSGNWNQLATHLQAGQDVLVNEGEQSEVGQPPFSALGFARLSIGTGYLAKYSAEVLARDLYTHLVDYHHASPEAEQVYSRTDESDPENIAEKIASEHLDSYLAAAGLNSAEKLIEALNPHNESAEYSAMVQHIARNCGVGDQASSGSLTEWQQPIDAAIETNLEPRRAPEGYAQAAKQQRTAWIKQVEDDVMNATREFAARRGLKVATLLVNKAAIKVKSDIREELLTTRDKNLQWSGNWRASALQRSSLEFAEGKIDGDNPQLAEYVREAVRFRWSVYTAEVCEDAASLAEQLVVRLLEPLEQELERGWLEARSQREQFPDWTVWRTNADLPEPGSSALPALGDFTLIEDTEYQGLLRNNMEDTFGADWRGDVRTEITEALSNDKGIVYIGAPWMPEGEDSSANYATVKTSVTREALLEGANALLWREGSDMQKLLDLSLKASLDVRSLDGVASYGDRLLSKLPAAIEAAAPLADIDQSILSQVHTNANPSRLFASHFSNLPFSGHPKADEVRALLSGQGVSDETLNDLFSSDDDIRHIDITSALVAPHSPLVFQSLLKPIAEDWHTNVTQRSTHTFWMHRSARPLARTVPCSQAALLCMTRGWFTARMLGLTSELPIAFGRDPYPAVTISRQWKGGSLAPAEFPSPLLSPPRSEEDYLGVLLDSLGLAFVEVSRRSSLDPLEAYIQLRDLGRSDPETLAEYPNLQKCLTDWVETGELPGGADPDRSLLEAKGGDSPGERHGHLVDLLNQVQQQYEAEYNRLKEGWDEKPGSLSKAPLWAGMADTLFQALEQMLLAAQSSAK